VIRKKLTVALLILGLCLVTACSKEKSEGKKEGAPDKSAATAAAEGSMAPDFKVKDLQGKEVSLSGLKGKVVLVNFWATWCPPCKEEIPSMMKLNKAMEGKPFQMLAISIDEGGKADVESYFKSSGIARVYGVTGVPETFVVDKNGKVQKKIVGGLDWNSAEVLSYLNELMQK